MKKFGLSVATNFDNSLLDVISVYAVMEVFGKLSSDPLDTERRARDALLPVTHSPFLPRISPNPSCV